MKLCVCTYRSNHFTAANETTPETTVPNNNIPQFSVAPPPFETSFKILYPPAANIVGIPTRNENSVAAGRLIPKIIASMIVVPDRDAPGKIAATN